MSRFSPWKKRADEILAVLKILNRPTTYKLVIFCSLGISLNLLDLVGIFLFATFASGVANLVQGNSSNTRLENFLSDLTQFQFSTNTFLSMVAGTMLAALIIKTVASALLNRKVITFLSDKETEFALQTFKKYQSLNGEDFYSRTAEELYYSVSISASRIFNGVIYPLTQLIAEVFLLLLIFSLLLVVSPATTILATLFLAGSVFWIGSLAQHRTSIASKLIVESSLKIQEIARHTFDGYKELKNLQNRDLIDSNFERARANFAKNQAEMIWYQQLPRYSLEAIVIFSAAALAIYEISNSDIRTALVKLSIYMITIFRILPSFQKIQSTSLAITSGLIASRLSREILSLKEDVESRNGDICHQSSNPIIAKISVSKITYHYPNSRNSTLADLSFDLPGNCVIGLSGPSGIGKSTLLDIFSGIRVPTTGSVRFLNSQNQEFKPSIAYVPQRPFLLNDSILANITLQLKNSTEDLKKAKNLFSIFFGQESIERTSKKLSLESKIEMGTNSLSGGQLQRIAIIRALFTDANLIILDECFSGLDLKVTKDIFRELRRKSLNSSIIIVTHSKSVLKLCDKTFNVNAKRVTESK